ncbi:MAG: hypothetical protein QM529_04945 [Hydrotalea sp.]|nr:hypothetical protein [Hydrotalea sp.]
MKIYFITFANKTGSLLHPPRFSVDRIVAEATASGYFDRVLGFSENDLDKKFWAKHQEFILSHPRGFGYWLWRPQLVLQTLAKIDDGDMVVFADAGCTINAGAAAKKRMADYIDIVKKSKSGILSFQIKQLEKHWTKNDLLLALKADDKIKNSGQLLGGVWLLKKCAASMAVVREWRRIAESDYHLIDDSPSRSKNDAGFCEHRHDQSIFSILRKQIGTEILPNETDKDLYNDTPIIATKLHKKYWFRWLQKLIAR